MKFEVRFSETPTIKLSLEVKKQVSKRECTLYKVYSQSLRTHFALKSFPKTDQGKDRYQREKLVQHFNHPNIIRYVPLVPKDQDLILMTEYIKNGTFSQILEEGPLKTEAIVRTYFHQLIEGIEYIHAHGLAHLDLRLENIIVGSDYMLKILDFDNSQFISDSNLTSRQTARSCFSEEIIETTRPTAIDVFAAGQILYAFRFAKLPFSSFDDNPQNPKSYSYFLVQNKEFWRKTSQGFLERIKVSKEFIELVNEMLNPNPSERLTIQQIKESQWYKGPILNMKKVRALMKPRCRVVERIDSKDNPFVSFCAVFMGYCC